MSTEKINVVGRIISLHYPYAFQFTYFSINERGIAGAIITVILYCYQSNTLHNLLKISTSWS